MLILNNIAQRELMYHVVERWVLSSHLISACQSPDLMKTSKVVSRPVEYQKARFQRSTKASGRINATRCCVRETREVSSFVLSHVDDVSTLKLTFEFGDNGIDIFKCLGQPCTPRAQPSLTHFSQFRFKTG